MNIKILSSKILEFLKSSTIRTANQFGFEISRIPKGSSLDLEYEPVRPFATYSPWNKDDLFQEVIASVQGFTLVDKYRCFELWKLIEQTSKLKNGNLIEVGVWRGGTGAIIAKKAKKCKIRDKVYLCDTFTGVVKAGEKDSTYRNGEHADTSLQAVSNLLLKQMNLDNVELLEGIFPDQTGHQVEGMQFRFCHIDVDVYQSAKDVVEWIWDKMVPCGVIVFDDYGFFGCDGITKFVNEQMEYNDRFVIHNLNGHAIILKL
ncbi:MAG: class I SAM-dependent methyltransferase [Saprospiraceae bacterium]|nr:class I SAM-dependent methyltransferase [Saprospiraceae bacterium]